MFKAQKTTTKNKGLRDKAKCQPNELNCFRLLLLIIVRKNALCDTIYIAKLMLG